MESTEHLMNDTSCFKGKVALITGGSRGIGRATVELLADSGAKIAFTYYSNKHAAEQLHQKLQTCGAASIFQSVDNSDPDALTSFYQEVCADLGRPQFLVNNAAISNPLPVILTKDETWHKIMDTDLAGTFYLCRLFVQDHLAHRSVGSIVNVSSIAALNPPAGQAAYAAAKAGMVAFTGALAKEIGTKNIRINTVLPGWTETDMVKSLPEERRRELEKNIPLRRFARPSEIAQVIRFTLSEEASYLHGSTLVVDGGLSS